MTLCLHCSRTIVMDKGEWVDLEATGDDGIWRETCDANDTFTAEHEPEEPAFTIVMVPRDIPCLDPFAVTAYVEGCPCSACHMGQIESDQP